MSRVEMNGCDALAHALVDITKMASAKYTASWQNRLHLSFSTLPLLIVYFKIMLRLAHLIHKKKFLAPSVL